MLTFKTHYEYLGKRYEATRLLYINCSISLLRRKVYCWQWHLMLLVANLTARIIWTLGIIATTYPILYIFPHKTLHFYDLLVWLTHRFFYSEWMTSTSHWLKRSKQKSLSRRERRTQKYETVPSEIVCTLGCKKMRWKAFKVKDNNVLVVGAK